VKSLHTGHVPAWNPIGLISLGIAVLVGGLGIVGVYPTYYASFLAMVIGPVLHVALTVATRGRYYGESNRGAFSKSRERLASEDTTGAAEEER